MDLTSLLSLPANGLVIFLMVLVRTSSIFLTAPVLGNSNIPMQVKLGLSLLMTLILVPLLASRPLGFDPGDLGALVVAVLQEVALGVVIGLLAQLLFIAIQFAGQVVGMQMGFGMASLFDPTFHTQSTVVAQFYMFVGMLVFLIVDGHHYLLIALARSFDSIPLGSFHLDGRLLATLIASTNAMFWTALMIMAPVIGVLILGEVALGLVARIMPQMNIFVASFPIKIGLGILTIMLSLPMLIGYIGRATETTFVGLFKFLAH